MNLKKLRAKIEMQSLPKAIRLPGILGKLTRSFGGLLFLFTCGLLFGTASLQAVTVKVDSTQAWIGWLNVFETNNAWIGGFPLAVADVPAKIIPANSPSGWPFNAHLVLQPNTSTYNPADPYWNYPDGTPKKVLEPNFYVDVATSFAGQTVTFQGNITSNSLPGFNGPAPHGAIGLGAWNTSVQYSNIVVTSNGVTLYQSDFVNQGATGWNAYKGTWSVSSGLYRQTAIATDCRSTTGNTNWANYTITLRARKIIGNEGFLILFNWLDNDNWTWWNVGGWNNTMHGIERTAGGSTTIIGSQVPGVVLANTWYDLRIELNGPRIRCFLNGSLVHDLDYPPSPATGWEAIAFIKEFNTSYALLGMASAPLRANSPFSVSRAIAPGRICQYGFIVKGPNTAPESANALTGVGIVVEDADPVITVNPVGGTINKGATVSLAVTAVGSTAPSYQWRRGGVNLVNGGNIAGADTATLTISNAQLSDSGEYTVRVSNAGGSVVSQPAPVTVLCVLANEGAPFLIQNIAASTNGGFTLAWESCSEHLYEVQSTDGPSASNGWTPRSLMVGKDGLTTWTNTYPSATNQGFYRVQRYSFEGDQDADGLSNLAEFNRGTDLRNPDTDGDQFPDGWETRYGFDPLSPTDKHRDLDGDGYSDFQEYQMRTRPNASYSHPADLPPGLVAWWKLDEGTGTNVLDSSRNGHDGYVLGGDGVGGWTTGYLSNAVTLGGPTNHWIEVPYQPSLVLTQAFTLMGWVKPAGQGVLIGNWDKEAISGNYQLRFGPDLIELRFRPEGTGTYQPISFDPNWASNQWHHVAVCCDSGTNVTVFVDGEWRASQLVAGLFVPVPNPLRIGFPGLSNVCSVDDVRLYNRALATNEIASLSRGNGLPVSLIVGQTAALRAFGAPEGSACQWSIVSGQGFFTNVAGVTAEFRPSWSGAVTLQVVWEGAGVFHTNRSSTMASFPSRSPLADWNDGGYVQFNNNCYNFATDIRTDTIAQPGGPPFYYLYTCSQQISAAISDGLHAGVDLADLCHSSGLPAGHIVALLIWPPNWDFHYVRLEANGLWSSKAGNFPATTLDNAGQPIVDPRTANFGSYQFCQFLWVGPDVNILHYPQ